MELCRWLEVPIDVQTFTCQVGWWSSLASGVIMQGTVPFIESTLGTCGI